MADTPFTLQDMITEVRSRCDIVVNQVVTDTEITTWLNKGWAKTYDLILTCYGENYWASVPIQFSISGTSNFYPFTSFPDPTTGQPMYKRPRG